ncbi:c-type cytochrome [Cognataquiflexum rubidum]|uniref:c-type cytochrome n=1 Tax=Cognataquiflexum rubidum TaxID=2922273 RepID=UPI001F13F71A|nr:cytochrome c [Cognataquiflexum rubidum]MCH6232885.1 cytochrome c [Cognataquiflexum rubidum]
MKTAPELLSQKPSVSLLERHLAKPWMFWAVFFFLMASLFGLLMRYFLVGEVSFFEYKHILHAHSHLALLGWGYLLVTGALVFTYVKDAKRLQTYKVLLGISVFTTLGMMLSFPFQGYGLYSITFSSLHLISSYFFAYFFLQDLCRHKESTATRLVRFSIIWLLVSSLGLWAIGPVGATLGRLHPLYFMSVQWFLHFQLNGWFVYGFLGLLVCYLQKNGWSIPVSKKSEWILHISLFLTYALAVSWSTPIKALFFINAAGVILQVIAYYRILNPAFNQLFEGLKFPKNWIDRMLYIGMMSLVAKALIQAALIIPDVATIAYTIRMYVIGFVHLVMLGSITFGIGAFALKNNWLGTGRFSGLGWQFLALAFLASEILLLGQGTLLWAKLGFIPQFHLILFLASTLFPLGLILIWLGLWHKPAFYEAELTIENNIKTQFYKNRKTMKSTMIMTMGVTLLLMASCGGGGENQSTTTPPTTEETVKEADPQGVGEFKNVEVSATVEDALAEKGKAIVDMKCTACHQLNDKRLVGPGFQGVTNRRRPEWIMNMITNVDVMLDEDPVAQALFEECLTRMPNQNISSDEARQILEFMRKNDLEKAGSMDGAAK